MWRIHTENTGDNEEGIMPQSLTRLPKTADIVIVEYEISIRNHMVTNNGLWGRIFDILWSPNINIDILCNLKNMESVGK